MNRTITNDIDVAYATYGTGEPAVFIHGLAEDHRSCAAMAARPLARVTAP